MKNKANSARINSLSNEKYSSPFSISDNSFRKNRKILKEKIQTRTDNNKNNYKHRFLNFPDSLSESKEFDLSREHIRDSSNENNYSQENNNQNLNIEIDKILIDIYNYNIKSEKKKPLDLTNYEKLIKGISLSFDKHYNVYILYILSEKIKELVQVK